MPPRHPLEDQAPLPAQRQPPPVAPLNKGPSLNAPCLACPSLALSPTELRCLRSTPTYGTSRPPDGARGGQARARWRERRQPDASSTNKVEKTHCSSWSRVGVIKHELCCGALRKQAGGVEGSPILLEVGAPAVNLTCQGAWFKCLPKMTEGAAGATSPASVEAAQRHGLGRSCPSAPSTNRDPLGSRRLIQ